ncbi:MAG: DedA family protein [Candidatus Glassbacteria bacterium]|nr:DedA family protein [Candidatus Glassbacteria bacterium]
MARALHGETTIENFISQLTTVLPPWLLYLLLAVAAAVENLFPPFPGDTTIVFGAYLAGLGALRVLPVYLWTVAGNLASNLLIYYLGLSQGRDFIRKHPRMFHQELIPRMTLLYRRWGVGVIFISRFLVGMRTIVPLFAGVSRFRLRRFLLPIVVSILIQHALLVYLGHAVGRNWNEIKQFLGEVNLGLGFVALALLVVVIFWFRAFGRRRRKKLEKTGQNQGDFLP